MCRKRKDEKEKEINQIILVFNIIYMTLFIISVLIWASMVIASLYALTTLPNEVDDRLDD